MATRILILDPHGTPLFGLDGHHGERHAAEWAATVSAQVQQAFGFDPIVVELHPAEGGDACRQGVVSQLHRLRGEVRALPDGRRELIALNRYPDLQPAAQPATVGAGRGLAKNQAAAPPEAVRGALRVLAGPADIANRRHGIRIPPGRLNVPPGQPRTIAELRHARRAARAAARPRTPR